MKIENRYGFKIFAFGLGDLYENIKREENIGIIYELSEDAWQGQRGIMLRVVDFVV